MMAGSSRSLLLVFAFLLALAVANPKRPFRRPDLDEELEEAEGTVPRQQVKNFFSNLGNRAQNTPLLSDREPIAKIDSEKDNEQVVDSGYFSWYGDEEDDLSKEGSDR
jgi:hypothetical protein